jgi:hypothetical protein
MRRPTASLRLIVCLLAAGVSACDKHSPTAPTQVVQPTGPASTCTFSVSDGPTANLAAPGADFTVTVTTAAGCAWSASSSVEFIAPVGATSMNGPGAVQFNVQPNGGGAPRAGSVLVAGRTMTITQASVTPQTCEFTISPSDATVKVAGGELAVTITATSGLNCPWTATSGAAFVSIKSGTEGSGSGTVLLNLSSNTGAARVGTVTIGDRTLTILQEGFEACPFSVAPMQASAPAGGGNVVVTLSSTNGAACAWIAISQSSGLMIAPPSGGSGNGSVTLVVAANPGTSSRTLIALVGGQQVRIDQVGSSVACAFSISPTSLNVPASGGGTAVVVQNTQGSACEWAATSSSPWINLISGSGGLGNATVPIVVQPNPGPARSGTVTIGGKVFAVQQEAGGSGPVCAFSVTPGSLAAPAETTFLTITVTNTQGSACPWTATPSAPWLSFMQGTPIVTGYGNGSFQVIANRNIGPARTASVDVAGHTVSISQGAQLLPANAVAMISFESDPADYIGQGQSRSYTFVGPTQFALQLYMNGSAFSFSTALGLEPNLSVTLEAPQGQALAAGYFNHAQMPTEARPLLPGLDVSWDHRGCDGVSGRFMVGQIAFDSSGNVQRLHATFEQYCGHRSAALRGTIWIDLAGSTSPPPPPVLPPISQGTTQFTATSDPGDVLGSGSSLDYTLANAVFGARGSATQTEVTVSPKAGGSIFLRFVSPSGNLGVGTYDSVSVVSSGSGSTADGLGTCSAGIKGKFTILEHSYGPTGALYTLRMGVELRCGAATAAYRISINLFADPWR